MIKLETMADVRAANRALEKTRSPKRAAALAEAIENARHRATVDCCGEAHTNPHIDHCGLCAPFWGKVLP